MAETNDAYTLVSDARTSQELAYAEYANKMKALANEARKEIINTPRILQNKEAKEKYAKEVSSLKARLNVSLMNAPRERAAQLAAASVVQSKRDSNPDISKAELKKIGQKALMNARSEIGAKRNLITLSDKDWEAIQSGAISENLLTQIIRYVDKDKLRQLATPKDAPLLSETKKNRIKALSDSGHTNEEIASIFGVSSTLVSKVLQGKE